jgi:hypothetical protein
MIMMTFFELGPRIDLIAAATGVRPPRRGDVLRIDGARVPQADRDDATDGNVQDGGGASRRP